MSVTATLANPIATVRDELRLFLRDYFNKNPLHDDVEFVDSELDAAMTNAVRHANVIDRPTSWTVDTFPDTYVLMIGASGHLTKSESIRQLRNQAQFQDGNIQSVGLDEKSSAYLQLSQVLTQEFTQHVRNIKITTNLPIRGFGSPLSRAYSR